MQSGFPLKIFRIKVGENMQYIEIIPIRLNRISHEIIYHIYWYQTCSIHKNMQVPKLKLFKWHVKIGQVCHIFVKSMSFFKYLRYVNKNALTIRIQKKELVQIYLFNNPLVVYGLIILVLIMFRGSTVLMDQKFT